MLGYLCVLHARFAGWVGQRGLAALAVVCFSLVVMAWYGVNFVLGAGLHSYGFGGGGKVWVLTAVFLEMLFAGLVFLKSRPGVAGSPLPPEFPRVFQARITAPFNDDAQVMGTVQNKEDVKFAEKMVKP